MRYLPHTDTEIAEMLREIGVESVDDLFDRAVPKALQLSRALDLPAALSEDELLRELGEFAEKNAPGVVFLGAGAYDHISPTVIDSLIQRGEFLTAYTPYQPEVSQGTLTAIFEFQTLITQLTGMEVANASMYEGGSATAEACMMAARVRRKNRFVVSRGVHPHYRQIMHTYLAPSGAEIVEVDIGADGATDIDALVKAVNDDTAAVIVQSPNFLGVIEDIAKVTDAAHAHQALGIITISEATSLGLLKPPGELGADIVCGEGQGLGVALNSGGPYVGFFACRMANVRAMPGRLAGETVDSEGKRGYVLTLATREQHIRRERATSNICTNQGLIALAATIFMSLMGKQGMRQLARLNLSKAEYAKQKLTAAGARLPLAGKTYNEFVIETSKPAAEVLGALSERGFVGGADLSRWYPEMTNRFLVAVTERRRRKEIDAFAAALGEIL